MKKIRLLVTVSLIGLLAGFNSVNAQTKQIELHAEFTDGVVWCLGKTLSGSWTYHITYHINKKTGEVDNVHWNLKHAKCWDEDMNKYNYIDTGNDKLGAWWNFFNNINFWNDFEESGINFDPPDGWLDPDVKEDLADPGWPTVVPEVGMMVNTFKFVGQGHKVTWRSLMQIHMNEHGDITVKIVDTEALYCD